MFRLFSFNRSSTIYSCRSVTKWSPVELKMRQLNDSGQYSDVFQLYNEKSNPCSHIGANFALKAMIKLKDYQNGIRIHQQLSKESLEDPFVQTSLIHLYMQKGDVSQAEKIFFDVKKRTIYMYGAMFTGYVANGKHEKVLELFDQMTLKSDEVIIISVLNACAKLADENAVRRGLELLRQIPKHCFQHAKLVTTAIDMLMRFHRVQEAETLFERLKNKTIVTYNAMINGYFLNDLFEKALDLYESKSLEADALLYTILFTVCASLANDRAFRIGEKLLHQVKQSSIDDVIMTNSALNMLMHFGDVQQAESLFESMKTKRIDTFGIMINGLLLNELHDKALSLFEKIPFELNGHIHGIIFNVCGATADQRTIRLGNELLTQMPKTFLNNADVLKCAVGMLIKFGEWERAKELCSNVDDSNLNKISTMIKVLTTNEQPIEAMKLIQRILVGKSPLDISMSTSLINACARIGFISISDRVLQRIPSKFHRNSTIVSSLIDMWGKVGRIDRAENIFRSISEPNIVMYNSMINAYAKNGMGIDAVELYQKIPVKLRNNISVVCVLNACSHAGLIDEAQTIYRETTTKTKQIVTVMIDCFSRMFMFEQAEELLHEYEQSNPPSIIMYMTILSGARNHRQHELSQRIYDRLQHLFPNEKSYLISGSILLSNTYSSIGELHRSEQIRLDRRKNIGNKVKPGITWTDFNEELIEFYAHDRRHPESDKIYAELNLLSAELNRAGHQFDSSWIVRPLKEDETIESVLCGHSEKLAIAFRLMQKPRPTMIQLVKNLRVCGDCHRATKLIAKIRQCDIIVRDATRIHHFQKNGQCSCQDHF